MFHLSRKLYSPLLIIFLLLAGTNACKDEYNSVIPYVYVNFEMNMANKTELIPIGGYYKTNGGYGGIIIFHDIDDSYLAFDAACTHEISPSASVATDGSGIAICPVCKSQYVLFGGSGSPNKGPAIEPLKQYHTSVIGGRLIIKN